MTTGQGFPYHSSLYIENSLTIKIESHIDEVEYLEFAQRIGMR